MTDTLRTLAGMDIVAQRDRERHRRWYEAMTSTGGKTMNPINFKLRFMDNDGDEGLVGYNGEWSPDVLTNCLGELYDIVKRHERIYGSKVSGFAVEFVNQSGSGDTEA